MKSICFFLFVLVISVYKLNGQAIKYADLVNGQKGQYESYISKDGSVYKIGDKIIIGVPSSNKTFSYITYGDGIMFPITPLTSASSGSETEIKKIYVTGNKRAGYSIVFRTKGYSSLANYTIRFEIALENGEVKGFGMTSDDALAQLKKAKDKLDLGIIKQEEYDKIKAELSVYIH